MDMNESNERWKLIRAQAKRLMELADEAEGRIRSLDIATASGNLAYMRQLVDELREGYTANADREIKK